MWNTKRNGHSIVYMQEPINPLGSKSTPKILNKGTTINDLGGGAGGNFRNEFIFSPEPLPYKIFFLGKASQNLFFPWQRLSKFIFSPARPLKIYFFLGEASQNFFFPAAGSSKFFFFPEMSLPKKKFAREKQAAIVLS